MKRILIWTLVLGVGLFAIVYGVGLLLPQDHVATVRAEFSAQPEEVFEAISDYRGHPEWRSGVERIEELADRGGRPAWREISGSGPLPMVMSEREPPTRMVTTMLSEGMPFGGRWVYEVEPLSTGSTVSITEEGEIYNPIFRFVSRFIMGHHATAATYLEDLGGKFGEEIEIEIVR